MRQDETTLVVGGTGKTGRRVAERIAKRGMKVRIGSRGSDPAFDWEDRTTWSPALDGVGSVYVTFAPDLAVPGAPEAIREFTRLALASGVRRGVLLSGRGEEGAAISERAMREAGADWTVLRASWFSQNFSESFLLEPLSQGTLRLPAGAVGEPFIDVRDIADVAVTALTEEGHAGALYELTGPRLLTFAEAVREIAEASGRRLRYEQIAQEAFVAGLGEAGESTGQAELLSFLFAEVLDGRNAHVTGDVQRVLGREPRDFGDSVREIAATGVWSSPGEQPEKQPEKQPGEAA